MSLGDRLRPHQLEDFGEFVVHPRHLYRSEPGTQKTAVVVTLQRYHHDEDGSCSVWVMPKSLMEKNRDEALDYGEWPDAGDVRIVDGTPKQVAKILADGSTKVLICGFTRFAAIADVLPNRFRILHVDEFHKGMGGDASQATQAMYRFLRRPGSRFVPMTGTLLSGSPDTAYPAIAVINPLLYGSLKIFQGVHHVVDPFSGKTVRYDNLDVLRDWLDRHGVNRTFAEVHGSDTRPVIQLDWLHMHPEQRRMYDELQDTAVLELERFMVDGTLPGVGFMRCRQVMDIPNFFPDLTDETGKATVDILDGELTAKAEALIRYLVAHKERDTPVLVFAALVQQQREALRLARAVGLRAGFVGDVPAAQRAADDLAFREGRLDCLVCSPQVADAGFNWQFSGTREVGHVIYASLDFRDTTFTQSYRRVTRGVRQTPLLITVLAYRKTLDRRVIQIVEKKSLVAHEVDPSRAPIRILEAA